jgi:hypothetical protein
MSGNGDHAARPRDLGPLEALGRVAKVFYAPRHVAGEIRDSPNWVFPLLLSVLFSFFLAIAVFSRPEAQEALQKALANTPRTLGELERVQLLKTMRVMAWIVVVAAAVLGNVLLALLLWGTAALLEGRTRFLNVFSLQLHLQMVTLVPQALGLGILLAKGGGGSEDPGDSLPFSLAYFLPAEGMAPLLRSFASAIDLFSLWYWGLVLLSLPIVAGVPRKKLVIPVLVLLTLSVLVRAATLALAVGKP